MNSTWVYSFVECRLFPLNLALDIQRQSGYCFVMHTNLPTWALVFEWVAIVFGAIVAVLAIRACSGKPKGAVVIYDRCPKVGVGVVILNERGWFLASKRLGSHGAGEWSMPGGHLEWMESDIDCAAREVLEETGLRIGDIQKLDFTNNPWPQWDKHYITLFYSAKVIGGTLQNMEPDRHEEWVWCDPKIPPQPLFGGIQYLIDTGKI